MTDQFVGRPLASPSHALEADSGPWSPGRAPCSLGAPRGLQAGSEEVGQSRAGGGDRPLVLPLGLINRRLWGLWLEQAGTRRPTRCSFQWPRPGSHQRTRSLSSPLRRGQSMHK